MINQERNNGKRHRVYFTSFIRGVIAVVAALFVVTGNVNAIVVDANLKKLNSTPYTSALNFNGYLDAVADFEVDNTGNGNTTTNTTKLQNCINAARDNHLAVYLPQGTYKINNTLVLENPYAGDFEGTRNIVIVGETGGARPQIKLANGSFNNVSNPRPVFEFKTIKDNKHNGPGHYNTLIKGIDIYFAASNSGAVGIWASGAQGCSIQDVKISGADTFFAGIQESIGAGAATCNIEIVGGKYGIHASKFLDCPVYTGLTLTNQTTAAIFTPNSPTNSAITVMGFHITKQNGTILEANRHTGVHPNSGNLAFIDGVFELTNPGTALGNKDASVYLQNVYFNNATTIVRNDKGNNLAGASGWTHVTEYSFFDQGNAAIVDGSKRTGSTTSPDVNTTETSGVSVPDVAELISRHIWDEASFPTFETTGIAVVSPSGGNDTNAIQNAIDGNDIVFLKRGDYYIDDTIELRANTQLFGVARHLTRIKTHANWSTGAQQQKPMMSSPDDASATTTIAFFMLWMPTDPGEKVQWLDWQSGRNSMIREVWFFKKWYGAQNKPNKNINIQRIKIQNSGGGRIYSLFTRQAFYSAEHDDFRHLLIEGTSEPLFIYGYCPEYAFDGCDFQSEVKNSENVVICGVKAETKASGTPTLSPPALGITGGSKNVFVISGGGLEYSDQYTGSLEIHGSDDILVVNKGRRNGHPAATEWYPWSQFYDIRDADVSGPSGYIACSDPFVSIFKKGNPVFPNINAAPPPPQGSGGEDIYFECEDITISGSDSNVNNVPGSNYVGLDNANANGTGSPNHMNFKSNADGDYITYAITPPAAGDYDITVCVRARVNAPIAIVKVNGSQVGGSHDFYLNETSNAPFVEFVYGTATLNAGSNAVTIEVAGKNASSTGRNIRFDFMKLTSVGGGGSGNNIQIEDLGVVSSSGKTVEGIGNPAHQIRFHSDLNDILELSSVNIPTAGNYTITIGVKFHPGNGMVRLKKSSGTNLGEAFDLYAPTASDGEVVVGSGINLTAGDQNIKFKAVSGSAGSGYNMRLDWIRFDLE